MKRVLKEQCYVIWIFRMLHNLRSTYIGNRWCVRTIINNEYFVATLHFFFTNQVVQGGFPFPIHHIIVCMEWQGSCDNPAKGRSVVGTKKRSLRFHALNSVFFGCFGGESCNNGSGEHAGNYKA